MTQLGIDVDKFLKTADGEVSDLDQVLRLCGLNPQLCYTDGRVRLDLVSQHLQGIYQLLEQQDILLDAQTQRILDLAQPTYFYKQVGAALGDWGPGDVALEQAVAVKHPLPHGMPLYARVANN